MSDKDATILLEADRRKAATDRNHELRTDLQRAAAGKDLAKMLDAFIRHEPDPDVRADAIRLRSRAVFH